MKELKFATGIEYIFMYNIYIVVCFLFLKKILSITSYVQFVPNVKNSFFSFNFATHSFCFFLKLRIVFFSFLFVKRRETQSTNFKTTFTLESGTFYLDVSIFFFVWCFGEKKSSLMMMMMTMRDKMRRSTRWRSM